MSLTTRTVQRPPHLHAANGRPRARRARQGAGQGQEEQGEAQDTPTGSVCTAVKADGFLQGEKTLDAQINALRERG